MCPSADISRIAATSTEHREQQRVGDRKNKGEGQGGEKMEGVGGGGDKDGGATLVIGSLATAS